MPHGCWSCGCGLQIKHRKNGATAGTSDAYYRAPSGKRYRSRKEVVAELGLLGPEDRRSRLSIGAGSTGKTAAATGTPAEMAAAAAALVERARLAAPLALGNGVTVQQCAPHAAFVSLCLLAQRVCARRVRFGAARDHLATW